jgi:hypothetical protein
MVLHSLAKAGAIVMKGAVAMFIVGVVVAIASVVYIDHEINGLLDWAQIVPTYAEDMDCSPRTCLTFAMHDYESTGSAIQPAAYDHYYQGSQVVVQ